MRDQMLAEKQVEEAAMQRKREELRQEAAASKASPSNAEMAKNFEQLLAKKR